MAQRPGSREFPVGLLHGESNSQINRGAFASLQFVILYLLESRMDINFEH